jgi:hypothetical protein
MMICLCGHDELLHPPHGVVEACAGRAINLFDRYTNTGSRCACVSFILDELAWYTAEYQRTHVRVDSRVTA